MKCICGIDPGLSGAIAFYNKALDVMEVFDMPIHTIKDKKHIDLYALARIIEVRNPMILKAIIEEPHSMPKQGVASSFKFGHVCGVAQMAIAAYFIPMDLVRPNVWKKRMGLTSDKDACRQRASQIWPQFAHHWPLKKHDGRAEAALLCLYGLGEY